MNKTLEQLIEPYYKQTHNGFDEFVNYEDVITLLKQVREATIKECIKKAEFRYKRKTKTCGGYVSIEEIPVINKKSLSNLDLNIIELWKNNNLK